MANLVESLVNPLPDPAFWRGRRVLLTGHTGFKGAWLSLWLDKLQADVIGYALKPPTNPNLFDACSIKDKITSITCDVRNKYALIKVFKKYKAHNEKAGIEIGDKVIIEECRPLSKDKRWRIVELVSRESDGEGKEESALS